MVFKHPEWFLALLPLLAIFWLRRKRLQRSTIKFPNIQKLREIASKRTLIFSRVSLWVRALIFIGLIIALARPQSIYQEREVSSQGIDIMIAMDVSRSMAAEDLKPKNRLEVSKKTVNDFVAGRTSDRIGLVVYSGEAYTRVPLTYDTKVLSHFVNTLYLDMAGEGTAIGLAIATSLNRLKESDAKTKIIILLTDGENNSGEINPISAAQLAKDMGVKVYTIGVGKASGVPIPFYDDNGKKRYIRDPYGRVVYTSIDEETLDKIASITKAKSFRATDKASLEKIYEQINALEKSDIKTTVYSEVEDHFPEIVKWLLFLMVFELLVTNLFLVRVP